MELKTQFLWPSANAVGLEKKATFRQEVFQKHILVQIVSKNGEKKKINTDKKFLFWPILLLAEKNKKEDLWKFYQIWKTQNFGAQIAMQRKFIPKNQKREGFTINSGICGM